MAVEFDETDNPVGSGGGEPLLDLGAAGHAARVHHLAVDHHTRRGHDAVAHDLLQVFDLLQVDGDAFGLRHLPDQRNGGAAAFAVIACALVHSATGQNRPIAECFRVAVSDLTGFHHRWKT